MLLHTPSAAAAAVAGSRLTPGGAAPGTETTTSSLTGSTGELPQHLTTAGASAGCSKAADSANQAPPGAAAAAAVHGPVSSGSAAAVGTGAVGSSTEGSSSWSSAPWPLKPTHRSRGGVIQVGLSIP